MNVCQTWRYHNKLNNNNNNKNPQVEMKEIEDVEARISDLEVEIKLLRNVMVKNGNTNAMKKVLTEESVWSAIY